MNTISVVNTSNAPKLETVTHGNRWTTLGEVIYRFVQTKQTHTPEFKKLLEWFGRDRLVKLYEEERLKQSAKGRFDRGQEESKE